MKSSMLAVASPLVLAAFVAALSPAFANEIKPGDDIEISFSVKTEGAGGNAWVFENQQTVARGIIDKIEVCHGRYINAVTFFYNGRRGTKFGGPGGNCEFYDVPKTSFVKEVIVWRGDWINAIQFFPAEGEESKRFGDPAGGARVPIQDPDGGSLRQANGKSGDYVNQLELMFGLPYYVDDIDIKVDQPLKKMRFSNPKQIDVNIGNNCENPIGTVRFNNVFNKSATQSHSFRFANTTGVELETKFKVGAPIIAEGTVGVTASTSFEFETTEGAETTDSISRSYDYTVPEGRRIDAAFMAKEAEVKLPFSYNLYHYRNGNKRDHLPPKTYTGVYEGVLIASAETKLYEVDCKTGERVQEVASGDDLTPVTTATAATVEAPNVTTSPTSQATSQPTSKPEPAAGQTPDRAPIQTAASTSAPTIPAATRPTSGVQQDQTVEPPVSIAAGPSSNTPTTSSGNELDDAPSLANANVVSTTNGAVFLETDDGGWSELSDAGETRFSFEEIDRTDDCIYLFDASRNVLIVLDFARSVVQYADGIDGELFDLYDITVVE